MCPAVGITPPSGYFDPTSMHDVVVRVGNTMPTVAGAMDMDSINTLCAFQVGLLAKRGGGNTVLTCSPGPLTGRYVTIHIR